MLLNLFYVLNTGIFLVIETKCTFVLKVEIHNHDFNVRYSEFRDSSREHRDYTVKVLTRSRNALAHLQITSERRCFRSLFLDWI